MVVMSVEGLEYIDKSTGVTHKILGVFPTMAEAKASPIYKQIADDDEVIGLLTDAVDGDVERIE